MTCWDVDARLDLNNPTSVMLGKFCMCHRYLVHTAPWSWMSWWKRSVFDLVVSCIDPSPHPTRSLFMLHLADMKPLHWVVFPSGLQQVCWASFIHSLVCNTSNFQSVSLSGFSHMLDIDSNALTASGPLPDHFFSPIETVPKADSEGWGPQQMEKVWPK